MQYIYIFFFKSLQETAANLKELQERIRTEEKKSLQSNNFNSLDDFGGGDDDDELLIDDSGRRPPAAKPGTN